MANILELADEKLAELFSQWNIYTIILALALCAVIGHTILTATEPDIHPMILMRQSSAGRVRHPGESAVYRSPEVPEGMPLRSGLGVKLPTDPMYSSGRDGDLRYIWRRVTGEIPLPSIRGASQPTPKKQEILTVFGRQDIQSHDIDELNKEIAVIGEYLHKHGSKRVAIYLPNSVEFLSTVFACSFFGLTIVLIPFNLPHPTVVSILKSTNANALVAAAGSLPLEMLSKGNSALKQLVWVVEKTSRHMDWTEIPEGLGGRIDVSVWHETVQDHQGDLPKFPDLQSSQLGKIVTLWDMDTVQSGSQAPNTEAVEFTHGNLVAAIGALIGAIPLRARLTSTDLFFSADSFTGTYSLCLTFAALFSGASLAITSVAGPAADLTFAAKQIAPTVVLASAQSASNLHAASAPAIKGGLAKITHSMQARSLAAGSMPKGGGASSATKTLIGSTTGTLRLLFISEKAGTSNPPLSSHDICDLRIFTGARVIYALTAAQVAGAVAQTHIYDYRKDESTKSKHSHFGIPLSCLEIKLVDAGDHKTTEEDNPKGEIFVSGYSVAGGEANIHVAGTFRDDCTLAYL